MPKDLKEEPARKVGAAVSSRCRSILWLGRAAWSRSTAKGSPSGKSKTLSTPSISECCRAMRVLVAEYTAQRVTERDLKGKILWEVVNLPNSPMNVQRLANGNTFIALYGTPATGGFMILEVDAQGKTVATCDGSRGVKTSNPHGDLQDGRWPNGLRGG